MELDIFHLFSYNAKKSLSWAANFAWQKKAKEVVPFHILNGLIEQKLSLAAKILADFGITKTLFNTKTTPKNSESLNQSKNLPIFNPATKNIIEKSAILATKNNHPYISSEHLLQTTIESKDKKIEDFFSSLGVKSEKILENLKDHLQKVNSQFELVASLGLNHTEESKKNESALEYFCTDLNQEANLGKIDPVIGREKEIERLTQILARRNKNNPIIVGEAGVGKTAIAEGLALLIVQKDVPIFLKDKIIYSLDLGSLVAGTMYRGEFESRFKKIIEEVKTKGNIILFIDEIHTIIGAGTAGAQTGSLDAANILKPALARGELHCIGATTFKEFEKSFSNDAALERRFQKIIVNEPSKEETLKILKGIASNYLNFHQVTTTDKVLKTIIELSSRYLAEKKQPDKSIDLLDEAAAQKSSLKNPSIYQKKLEKLKQEIRKEELKIHSLIKKEDLKKALISKENLKKLKIKIKTFQNEKQNLPKITENDIAKIIEQITGIPTQKLISQEKQKLLRLGKELEKYIIGQNQALNKIAETIQRSKAGIKKKHKPLGSFLLVGPSGVGKTELAKVLAKNLYEKQSALIKVDMSEFSEQFSVSKILGSPAGYIGYKDSNTFLDKVRQKPYAVILLDEIEKAHSNIHQLLLQILDGGKLTDSSGREIDFSNTIVILTSNLGIKHWRETAAYGFGSSPQTLSSFQEAKKSVTEELKKSLREEVINRLDEIIYFKPLSKKDFSKIIQIKIKDLESELATKHISLLPLPVALKFIAEKSFSPEKGARMVESIIDQLVANKLAQLILKNKLCSGNQIIIGVKNNQLDFVIK